MTDNRFLIINSKILSLKQLNPTDKLIYSYISNILNSGNIFFASNNEIALFLGISRRSVIRSIEKLESFRLISISYANKNRRIIKSTKDEEAQKLLDLFREVIKM